MIKDFLADTDAFDMPIVREAKPRPAAVAVAVSDTSVRRWVLGFAGLAALLRVGYLLFGTSDSRFVAWYIDSFHHWQVSYLTKEIGVFQGPRLWDLGGMEYFWGFIPAVLGALAMAVTFSSDLWPMQLMNIVAGASSVGVLYLVGRRYWSHWAGLALATFFAVSPVSVLTDASVMQEPVAFLFLALALYFFLDRPLLTGVLLGLAASSRPDYWLYSGALLAITPFALRAGGAPIAIRALLPYAAGYAIGIGPYVLHLWMQTGNPVYSLYWNFLGNVRGEWMPAVEPTVRQLQAQAAARVLLAVGVVGLALTAWRRPTGWPVIAAGLWGFFLIGYVLGISKYILGYLDRFWFDRIMLLPYLVIAVLVAIGVAHIARVPRVGRALAALSILLVAAGLSTMWVPIGKYTVDAAGFQRDIEFGHQAAAIAREGTILVPGDAVVATYALTEAGVDARRLLSQLYHPEVQGDDRTALYQWMRERDVRWLFIKGGDRFWRDLAERDPQRFQLAHSWVYDLYRVSP